MTSGERTEQERQEAREERERRRAAKQGAEAPPLPPPEAQLPVEGLSSVGAVPGAEARPPVQEAAPIEAVAAYEPLPSLPGTPPVETVLPSESAPSIDPALALASEQSERRHRLSRPHVHRSHLLRPHMHRPHIPRWRGRAARAGALLALAVVVGALAVGAVLLVRHSERPKIPPPPVIVKVVIPEGYTRAQIAVLAHADGLRGSYLTASKSSSRLRPSSYGAPTHPASSVTSSLEGFLFPATYEMYPGAPVSQLVSEQLAAFRENFGGAEVHRARVLGVTPYQLLIVASMIEREAAIPHDRPLVAAVIYNRLRQNMSLGIDSTLRYALHDFSHPLTEAELGSNSPYNTRTHKGLPPTPISNPGVAAIKAATRPAHVSYLYYVAGADGCGEQVFSTSYAQFERNAAAYREALSRNGGRVPRCKKG
jgi:cell division protein YceG involved in septum cleavage